jgi:hypothetical protein
MHKASQARLYYQINLTPVPQPGKLSTQTTTSSVLQIIRIDRSEASTPCDGDHAKFFYQLIVGPHRWATKVLRPTIGERYMAAK